VRHHVDGMLDENHLKAVLASLPCPWRERNGVCYIPTWSDSVKGRDWSRRLKQLGREVNPEACKVLKDDGFKTTDNVFRVIAVLTGRHLVSPPSEIFKVPPAEVACLLREQLLSSHLRAMGLSHIVVTHQPIQGNLLVVRGNELATCREPDPADLGQQAYGLAFMVHEVAVPTASVA
jgi:hypothetical protein